MFDYIKGKLTAKYQNKTSCFFTVENSGIGYLLEVSSKDFNKKNVNDEIKIFTILLHREDSMNLCGFLNKEARDIFNILISVSGVGSKMALCLLNEFEVSELIYFVINENSKELTRAKGVGVKLAQKIILELKDKLINLNPSMQTPITPDMPSGTEDVQNILISLGYSDEEVSRAINQVVAMGKDINDNEEFLRATLQILSV